MKNAKIIICHDCEHCEGVGIIYSPIWQKYVDDNLNGDRRSIKEWAWDNGYEGEKDMGPEEINCPYCAGEGILKKYIPIEQFGISLESILSISK